MHHSLERRYQLRPRVRGDYTPLARLASGTALLGDQVLGVLQVLNHRRFRIAQERKPQQIEFSLRLP